MADNTWWTVMCIATAPIWGTFLWHTYTIRLRPLLVSRECIRALVEIMLRQEDPEHAAFLREQAAWCRGDTVEQGVWRRVRVELRSGRGR